ncbi:MAG: hypothetical protein AAGG08_09135, partial [Actinomycetota bacterium]
MGWSRRRERTAAAPGIADPSAWAGEVDVPEPPPVVWGRDPVASGAATDESAAASVPPAPGRQRKVAAGLAAVAGVAVAALVLTTPASNGDAGTDADATPTSLGTLPPLSTEPEPAPTTTPATTENETDDETDTDDGSGESATLPGSTARDSVPVPEVVPLPAGLPEFSQPFEIVMATVGGLSTLSMPSGVLRRDTLGSGRSFEIVVAPDATLATDFATTFVVPRQGTPTSVPVDVANGVSPVGWFERDGTSAFALITWGGEFSTSVELVTFGADGAVDDPVELPGFSFTQIAPTGERLVD